MVRPGEIILIDGILPKDEATLTGDEREKLSILLNATAARSSTALRWLCRMNWNLESAVATFSDLVSKLEPLAAQDDSKVDHPDNVFCMTWVDDSITKHDLYRRNALSGKEEIRLLALHEPEDPEAPLEAHIEVVSIGSNPPPVFVAASYVWGPPVFDSTIAIEGVAFKITQSLEQALRRFRQTPQRRFWVDQICINQDDMEERGKQVQLMTKIYSRATSVFAWLGTPKDGADTVSLCQALSTLNTYLSKHLNAAQRSGSPELLTKVSEESLRILTSPGPKVLETLYDLYSREWFSRMWIVQEAVVSQTTFVFYGGMGAALPLIASIPFPAKMRPAGLRSHDTKSHTGPLEPAVGSQFANFFFNSRRALLSERFDVLQTMDRCRVRGCTDARDRVYAVQTMLPPGSSIPAPDYTSSVQEVYTGFARWAIGAGMGLKLLVRAGRAQQNLTGLPSWCPDWTHSKTPKNMLQADPEGRLAARALFYGRSMAVEDGAETCEVEGRLCRLGCTRTDTIDKVHRIDESRRIMTPVLSVNAMALAASCEQYGSADDRQLALCKLITANYFSVIDPDEAWHKLASSGVRYSLGRQHEKAEDDEDSEHAAIWNALLGKQPKTDMWRILGLFFCGRAICTTKKGYLAMAPAETREGDGIYHLGSDVPQVVLRFEKGEGQDEHGELLGDVFVMPRAEGDVGPETVESYAREMVMID